MSDATKNAARLLCRAEEGYRNKYGSVPLQTRINLARAWIDLARAENGEGEKS